MSRQQRIVQQLGMPHGTANNKLRKNLLFFMVQKLQLDECFKCTGKIESVDDFSVEHKSPWENISADLFWDLSNIAFSHLKCNRPHTNGATKLRKCPPDGQAWCYFHQDYHSRNDFNTKETSWNGLENRCREANKQRMQGVRKQNKYYGR